jgi:prepilin-type N-terminal cleavage/methylation domain-containing protein
MMFARTAHRVRNLSSARGFTLVELLAVMAILAILSAAFVVGFRKYQLAGEEEETRTRIRLMEATLDGEYQSEKGDFPPDDYEGLGGRPGNDLNTGSESMVAALTAKDSQIALIDSKMLGNTDDDQFPKKITKYDTTDAFEYIDRWGNPIAYFHSKHYGRKQKMIAKPKATREFEEQLVEAVKDPKTKGYYKPDTCQLISAGPDGRFGTDDDIANFEIKREAP